MSIWHEHNWHEQHPGNLHKLCYWIYDECDFTSAWQIVQVIEKPWNWQREWGLCELYYKYENLSDGTSREITQRCIEAVDEETTAEMVAAEFEVTL